MDSIFTSTPMVYNLGVKDSSTTQGAVQTTPRPDHLPLVFTWAQKARPGRHLVDASNLVSLFGGDTFDPRKKYATHQTELINTTSKAGNAQMIDCLVPGDAGPKANIRLSLEVAPSDVPVYQRSVTGEYLKDANGDYIPVMIGSGGDAVASTVPGFKVRWIKSHVSAGNPSDADSVLFGQGQTSAGTLVGTDGSATIYPVMEFWTGYFGSGGNNEGIRLMAPLATDDGAPNPQILSSTGSFVYRLQAISRASINSTPKPVSTLTGAPYMDFVLKPAATDPLSGAQIYLGTTFNKTYESIGDPLRENIYAGIPNVHIYEENVALLQEMFFQAEKEALDSLSQSAGSDIGLNEDIANAFKFNLLTFRNSGGAQYRCIEQDVDSLGAIVLGGSTNLYCAGGADGTMDNDSFNTLVAERLNEYADPLSPALDSALNPISMFYDSGFALETKFAAFSLLARRKDTGVVVSTYVEGENQTKEQEASMAIALRARAALYPESTYFSTPVTRAVIMARHGTKTDSTYAKRLPLTLWLAGVAAEMMGAGDGKWKAEKRFDENPRNVVTNFKDLNSTFTPASQRVVDWTNGLNYPIAFSMDRVFYPGVRTVYSDDTSVLTSFVAMMVCISLTKVGEQVWREKAGVTGVTGAQWVRDINDRVLELTAGKYAGLAKIVPKAYITGGDEQRGYSGTLPIEAYLNNAKTVMTLYVDAKRNTDA